MIDLKALKQNEQWFLQKFQDKGLNLTREVTKALKLYDEQLILLGTDNKLRQELNELSKAIGLDKNNQKLKHRAEKVATATKNNQKELKQISDELQTIVSYFPNPAQDDVPIGRDENANKILKVHNEKLIKTTNVPHWEILDNKNGWKPNEASLMSGTRQIVFANQFAKLFKAIEQFTIDSNLNNGYQLMETPVLVNKQALYNSSQLPKFEDDLFKVNNGQYLIPTAEVTLVNLGADKIFTEQSLPIKYCAITDCFRKEAGSAGRDTRGIIRLHQFRKCELVVFGKASEWENDFKMILNDAKSLLEQLAIPYREVLLATGDQSFGSQKTVDLEVWMPGLNDWKEISSVSCMGDFQARRMKSRIKFSNNDKKEFIYTYNGSSLPIQRTLAAIIENYYDPTTKLIKIPKVLQQYLSFKEF